ncbi:MAG: hypothetical protein ACF788_12995 [Novipirellula sp. JB048]
MLGPTAALYGRKSSPIEQAGCENPPLELVAGRGLRNRLPPGAPFAHRLVYK